MILVENIFVSITHIDLWHLYELLSLVYIYYLVLMMLITKIDNLLSMLEEGYCWGIGNEWGLIDEIVLKVTLFFYTLNENEIVAVFIWREQTDIA